MQILANYDVNTGHTAVKEAAYRLGFGNVMRTNVGPLLLPNTTLVVHADNYGTADRLFRAAVANAERAVGKINVEKLMLSSGEDFLLHSVAPSNAAACA